MNSPSSKRVLALIATAVTPWLAVKSAIAADEQRSFDMLVGLPQPPAEQSEQ